MFLLRVGAAVLALFMAASCATAPERHRSRSPLRSGNAEGGVASPIKSDLILKEPIPRQEFARSLSYVDVLERAQSANPTILAARAEARAAWQLRPQRSEFPDPTFRFGYFAEEVRTRTGDQVLSIGFSQRIPWPGRLQAQGRLADIEAQAAEVQAIITTRDVLVDVSKSFVEYDFLLRAVAVAERAEKVWMRVLAATERDPTSSRPPELIRAESELAQARFDRSTWEELAEVERARLRAHLSLPTTTPIGPPTPIAVPTEAMELSALQARALQHNPEFELTRVRVRMGRQRIAVAEQKDRPEFSLSGRYIATEARDVSNLQFNGNDPVSIELGVTLPLGRKARRASVEEASLRTDAAVRRREGMQRRLEAGVAADYWKVVNARRLVRLYEESLLPQAERAAAAAENLAEIEGGGMSGTLETVATWHHLQLAALRARADLALSTLELERRIGIPLGTGVNPDPQTEEDRR